MTPLDENVIKSIDGFSNQLDQAWQESQNIEIPVAYLPAGRQVKTFTNIVICGMGGSRFTPFIIKELFKEELTVPFVINDDYNLPTFVDKQTLVVLSSYSGTTEEVITCGQKAFEKKASLIGVTEGGDLKNLLEEKKSPCYVFDPVYNPSGQPRIGVGYMIGGILGILHKLGFIKYPAEEISNAIGAVDELTKQNKVDVAQEENPAKQMAQKLQGRYPYYLVAEFLTGVGNAIQNQTNETAKSISSFRVMPELNHHLMEGLKNPKDHAKLAIFIFFYSTLYSLPIQKRFTITREVVEQNKIETLWCELQGKNKVEQVFEMLAFSGYLTMYLSELYGEDPTTVPYVDYFKKKLKEG